MQITVEHMSGSKQGQLEQLEQAEGERITVGRNPTNKLQFDPYKDTDVSGDHAQLSVGEDGKLHVNDLGSRNGTLLNGTKLAGTDSAIVEPGSKIQFGANGPAVKVHYTPGPSRSQVQVDQLQQQLAAEKAAAEEKKKKQKRNMGIAAGVLAVLALVGGLLWSRSAKIERATTAVAKAGEMAKKAEKKRALAFAAADTMKARDLEAQAKKAMEAGDYVAAAEKATAAEKQYEDAIDAAGTAMVQKQADEFRKKMEEDEARRKQEQAAKEEEMHAQQEALEAKLREEAIRNKAEKKKLEEEMKRAAAADKQRLLEELEKLNKRPDSELARKIIADNEASLVFISVESFVQQKDTKARTILAKSEGSGYALSKDLVAVSKHVLQPWKYDSKVLATAKKMKEEYDLNVETRVEVFMSKGAGQPFEKKFDTDAGSCKILKVAVDKKVAASQTVQIDWNMQPLDVPGIQVHEKNVEDLAIISIPNGNLRPCDLASGSAQKFDGVLILGTVRDTGGNRAIKASPAKAEVQAADKDDFSLNCTVPATFAGAPVFKYDGKVWGIIAGTEGNNLVCLPIDRVTKLRSGGGGSTSGAAGGGAAPGGNPGDAPPNE